MACGESDPAPSAAPPAPAAAPAPEAVPPAPAAKADAPAAPYVCPMHPDVASATAGATCSQCGMDLVGRDAATPNADAHSSSEH